jgi:hypothetical protein
MVKRKRGSHYVLRAVLEMVQNDLKLLERRIAAGVYLPYIKKSDPKLWARHRDEDVATAKARIKFVQDRIAALEA